MNKLVVGIDLGGTSVRAGAFNPAGDLLHSVTDFIHAKEGPQAGLERIAGVVDNATRTYLAQGWQIQSIGVGSTGPLNRREGKIQNPYTLPGWADVPVGAFLRERFNAPVILENDADVAALGEYWQGAGQGVQLLYMVTIGTGIGTALIQDGRVYRGLDGTHPEGGHMSLDPDGPLCYCGLRGCWESLCAGPGLARNAQAGLHADPTAGENILKLVNSQIEQVQAHHITYAARQADPFARLIIAEAARYNVLAILNILLLFTPQMIVLGGGVMSSAELFLPSIQQAVANFKTMIPGERVKIQLAQLGERAGMYGAAFAALQEFEIDHEIA